MSGRLPFVRLGGGMFRPSPANVKVGHLVGDLDQVAREDIPAASEGEWSEDLDPLHDIPPKPRGA